jgi:hypothetical protein
MPNRVSSSPVSAVLIAVAVAAFAGGSCVAFDEAPSEEVPSGADNPMDWQTQGGLMTAPTKAPRTIAAMMFDITGGGGTTGGVPNATTIMNVVGGTGQSQRHMFQEISYGIQDTAPEYFGPFRLPVNNCLTIACCGPSSDKTGNGATVQMHMDAIGKTFDHYFWVYGKIPSGADCGTWGDEGSPSRIAKYSSYSFHSLVGYAQEIGHNFGMTHEPTLACSGNATFLDDTSQCTHKEYGNTLSFMGNGSRHPSAVHKYHQGWMSGCNLVKVGSSTTITLLPQELPCDGAQLLQVPAPKTRGAPAAGDRQGSGPMLTHYYLEMRGPHGFDSGIGPMVLVSIGPEMRAANQSAPYVYLLDMNAGTSTHTDAGLRAGGSYSDPSGGFTVTVNSIDNMGASVTITTNGTGGLTCGDNTAFTAPGPGASSCGPLAGGGTSTGVAGMSGGTGTGGRGGAGGATGAAGSAGRGGAGGGAGGRGGGAAGTGSGGAAGAGSGAAGNGSAGTGSGRGGTGTAGSGTGAGGTIATGTGGTIMTGMGGSGTGTGGIPTTVGTAGSSSGEAGAGGPGAVSGGCGCGVETTGATPAGLAILLAVGSIARRRSRRASRAA